MKLDITLFGALPFRRISKTAKRQRRTHLKKTAPTVTTCSNCGASGEFGDECPECGSTKIEKLRRVTGYLTGNYLTAFNKGKIQETNLRIKHSK